MIATMCLAFNVNKTYDMVDRLVAGVCNLDKYRSFQYRYRMVVLGNLASSLKSANLK